MASLRAIIEEAFLNFIGQGKDRTEADHTIPFIETAHKGYINYK
jgi:hypothetical protein